MDSKKVGPGAKCNVATCERREPDGGSVTDDIPSLELFSSSKISLYENKRTPETSNKTTELQEPLMKATELQDIYKIISRLTMLFHMRPLITYFIVS